MSETETIERLTDNLQRVRQQIELAAIKADRSPDSIKLVAVSKYVDASVTRKLVTAGCRVLGESRPQVLWEKGEKLQDMDVEWHLIGHLQRNKVKKTLLFTNQIHSCDSIRLFQAINDQAAETNQRVNCLLEVNISGEDAKHGFKTDELRTALERIAEMPNIRLNGLMGMGSWGTHPESNREEFRRLRHLRDQYAGFQADNICLNELSMGMSGDFQIAIEEGSTMVRIGSTLFEGIR